MSTIFKLWEEDGRKIWIREFNGLIAHIASIRAGNSPLTNYMPSHEILPFGIVVVSKEGKISTFSPELAGGIPKEQDQFVIGNVLNIKTLDELIKNENFKRQQLAINKGVENCAASCDYFELCGGGSPSNKYYETGSFEATETSHCIFTRQIITDVVLNSLAIES